MVVVALLLAQVNWVTAVLAPLVVAAVGSLVVQRLPQLRRPILVTVKLNDIDYLIVDDTQVPASGHTVRITVETTGPMTVLLDRLRPVIVSRNLPGGYLSPHLGTVPLRPFELLLDHDPPVLRPLPGAEGSTADFPFKVAANDPEVFDLAVRTEDADVRWYLELDAVCLGRRRTTRIDLAGRPFRTMARPRRVGREPGRVG
ncbi:hypothetical protein [Kutzneria sp. NPDC052558]|uniref:hypothetical protein n=1 Tax=Kutzneria sp. NPDC052558 TaxID=3364121 RepID=UPI0037C83A8E